MNQMLLSTAYLPPIEYFYYLVKSTPIFIEAYETYPKQTYRNRCNIFAPNGMQVLTIPVTKTNGNHTLTKNIKISSHTNWRLHHWKSLQTAYNTSAFFMFYKDELWKTMQYETSNLLDFNMHLLRFLMDEIGIKTSIRLTKDYHKEKNDLLDLRTSINPKHAKLSINPPPYFQVHQDKFGFMANLSILDLLFSEGPNTLSYLQSIKEV